MKIVRLTLAAMACAALAGCGSHMISTLAATPGDPAGGPAPLLHGARYIQAADGLYIQACGEIPRPGSARCYALARPTAFGERPMPQTAGFYGPSDLQSMYKLPSANRGKKVIVAIADAYDDPNLEADLAVYRANYGLPPCTTANGCFQKLNESGQQGPYPSPDANWGMEASVDVDMISAVCPNCHIMMIEADSSNLSDLAESVDEAASLGAHVVSTSWGSGEFSYEQGYDHYFNLPGVMLTVASGDGAYVAGTQYPAASPWVTAVGGTSPVPSKTTRGWTESVWYFPTNNPPQGSGSGCSLYETGSSKQSWQKDTGCTARMIADVSAVANSVAGYDTYGVSPGWYYFFGTSVASPVVAGVYGLANNAATLNYGSESYLQPSGVWDITKGISGTCAPAYWCTAEKGYDGPTGNGTPHGIKAF
jgi:subtilase family serine protease